MASELVAGIDLGTTSVRAGVFDPDGARLGLAGRPLGSTQPFAGALEQDPQALVAAAVSVLREACDHAGYDVSEVALLGITNQRASVVAWHAATGEPLHPVIGWQDTRTAARCRELRALGLPVTTSASCTKLEWLANTHPPAVEAARSGQLRLGTIDTWLTWRLSGGVVNVTDPSNAGATGLYGLGTRDWNPAALELFGIDRSVLADVVATDERVGTTDASVVGAEMDLAARAGDQMAACAAHALEPGATKLTLGTSGMVDMSLGTEPIDPPAGTYVLPMMWLAEKPAGQKETYIVEGSIQTAGAAVEWLVTIGVLDRVEDIDALARSGRPGVGFVPALAGLGSPHHDPDARAVLSGLGLDTGPAEIARAVLTGIAVRVAEITDVIGVGDTIHVDGGLSRSSTMLQLVADATGRTVRPAADPESTLHGIAQLAARAPRWRLQYHAPLAPS